jgi:hypothetical protein
MRRCIVLIVVLVVAAMAQAPTPSPKHESHAPSMAENQQEAQALAQDIARMRSLLQQMEMNLALVTTSQNPLKHQFELDIQMWRIVLDGMERRAQAMRGGQPSDDKVTPQK